MFISTLLEDPITKELYIEIPEELAKELMWVEGDILEWHIDSNDRVTLRKKENIR